MLRRGVNRLVLGSCLLALACAAEQPFVQTVQCFYPDSEQLQSSSSRMLMSDGSMQRHGAVQSWYPDGRPERSASFVNGVPDGEYRSWYADGRSACTGRWAMGVRTGTWSVWDAQGALRERSEWRHGMLDGEAAAWDEQGNPQWSGRFVRGRRDGEWTAYHAGGQASVSGQFEAGVPKGRWTEWYADGARAAEGRYKNGHPVGTWTCWTPQGELMLSISLRADRAPDPDKLASLVWRTETAPALDPLAPAAVFDWTPLAQPPELPPVARLPEQAVEPADRNRIQGTRVSLPAAGAARAGLTPVRGAPGPGVD